MDVERILEFDKLKSMLSGYAVSELGARLASELKPLPSREEVERELRLCSEAKNLILSYGRLPLEGLKDISETISKLRILGSILAPDQLLDILSLAGIAEEVRRFFKKLGEGEAPLLRGIALELPRFADLIELISSCISPEGEILDSASPQLRRIRAEIASLRREIQRRLESIISSPKLQGAIQERVITVRNGRYVIPVKQGMRDLIPGVVQGVSSSGATLFIEPLAVVELQNRLTQLAAEEEREIKRILAELTDKARERADDLSKALEILGKLDFISAKALFSIDYRCCEPKINEEGIVDLKKARHPILEKTIKEGKGLTDRIVPIDIHVGHDFNTLVITGPNTGGKTVALKTVGLLCLMALSGMHIPADDGSSVALFDGIYADIGDEQSIEQSLSTFSSHMLRIVRIIEKATPNSLVLLDELGAGTDPAEGAALGMAILDHFHSLGARTIVTTHHSLLKIHAHQTPGMENASVEFDPETLRPTYRLLIGVPGRSNALQIAARLGVPREILERAKGYMGEREMAVEEMLAEMDETRRRMERERAELRERLEQAEKTIKRYKEMAEQLKREKEEILRRAREEAMRIVSTARRTIEKAIREIRAESASKASIKRAHQAVEELKRRLAESEPERPVQALKLSPGDLIRIRSLNAPGKVVRIRDDKGEVTVQVGGMEITVPAADVEPLSPSEAEKLTSPQILSIQLMKRATVKPEINLVGCRVDEALRKLDKYLDDAFLAGLDQVRVIHGRGTGALRRAIREFLSDHPHVESFSNAAPNEGGDGVTVVRLWTSPKGSGSKTT